jgi:hypothetical protein
LGFHIYNNDLEENDEQVSLWCSVSRVSDVAAIVHPRMCDGGVYIW